MLYNVQNNWQSGSVFVPDSLYTERPLFKNIPLFKKNLLTCFQVVEDGYEFFAKRQLVTLFSAPNYCGEFDNAGAMMSVDETLMCSFQVRQMSDIRAEDSHSDKSRLVYHYSQTENKTFFVVFFAQCLLSLSPFYRFSNLQTRSCFMVEEGAWALVAQSPPQGKLRNDTSSLPSTSDPSLLPSLPLFSFLSPNSQKSNLYPGLFFLFYLYFLKHLMLQIV